MTKRAESALINHEAYIQADAESKNLNLEKFRGKIMAEMEDDSDKDGAQPNKKPRGFMQNCFLFLNVGIFFLWRFNFYGFYIALALALILYRSIQYLDI